jgi:uncharacterized protein
MKKTTKKTSKKNSVASTAANQAPIVVKDSKIHGKGVYASRAIKKGERVVEYCGERISHAEADRRYMMKGDDDGHTFLFVATNRTVIDGNVNGNDARFINHSCAPNCESVMDGGRVFLEAIRAIRPGDELGFDYQLTWESTDDLEDLANYVCLCGAKKCRGTMLDKEPMDVHRKKEAAKKRRTRARKAAKKKTRAKK